MLRCSQLALLRLSSRHLHSRRVHTTGPVLTLAARVATVGVIPIKVILDVHRLRLRRRRRPRMTPAPAPISMRGGFIGGSAGYNWQTGPWVLGIEGDYSWANITGSSMSCGFAPRHGCGTTLQSFGTLRGRVGYATEPGGAWLPYVTGGLAAGELQAWDALTPASGNAFRGGWSLGAGGRNRACSKLDLQGRVSLHGPWFSADVQHCARRAGNR
jgi:hypothetical protein